MDSRDKARGPTAESPYWTHDTSLFTGIFRYFRKEPALVRGKLHLAEESYSKTDADLEIIPITQKTGQCTYVHLKAYVLVPDVRLIVGLYAQPQSQGLRQEPVIGEIVGSTERPQMKEQEIGDGQAWYYPADQTLVLWECGFHPPFKESPHDPNMSGLWTGFEAFLIQNFQEARQIATTYADPNYDTQAYQQFLAALGYRPHPRVKAAWSKPLHAST